ncbi:MAG: hypothetical protein FJY37_08125, partial [Betaproteobacteria bacterium]|nr:hypothetical protein [Betaproteobacteria bacterium]
MLAAIYSCSAGRSIARREGSEIPATIRALFQLGCVWKTTMKITRIEPILVSVPFIPTDGESGFGGKTWSTVDTLLVRIDTDEGITGWGEAFGYNIIPGTIATLTHMIAPQLIGCDPTSIGPLMAQMQHRFHLFGRSGPAVFGLSGVDIALWDIAGKRAKLPLHQLLGGAARTEM